MNRILIVKLGSTFPHLAAQHGDFDDWIRARLDPLAGEHVVVRPHEGDGLPDPQGFAAVVASGSHAMVTDNHGWSERTAKWLRQVVEAETPFLGICYGHQLLAWAKGGDVGFNPHGREFGTVETRLTPAASDDPLFEGLPDVLPVHTCHAQAVLRLPPGATLLASSGMDPHHAFRLGPAAWGVQFHPEFDEYATHMYIEQCAEDLRREGRNPDVLRRAVRATPQCESLLRRLCRIASGDA